MLKTKKGPGFGSWEIICSDPIKNYVVAGLKVGYSFNIEYASYRGTYLSCITNLTVSVDGREIPKGDILFCLNGKKFAIDQLPDMYKEVWDRMDKAQILIMQDGGITPGEHTVDVVLEHRNPYSAYFGTYNVSDSFGHKVLPVEA